MRPNRLFLGGLCAILGLSVTCETPPQNMPPAGGPMPSAESAALVETAHDLGFPDVAAVETNPSGLEVIGLANEADQKLAIALRGNGVRAILSPTSLTEESPGWRLYDADGRLKATIFEDRIEFPDGSVILNDGTIARLRVDCPDVDLANAAQNTLQVAAILGVAYLDCRHLIVPQLIAVCMVGHVAGAEASDLAMPVGDTLGFIADCIHIECDEIACPTGRHQDSDSCECVCDETSCPSGRALNASTCECECETTSCPDGHTFNAETCECVPECEPVSCADGYVFDEEDCECRCQIRDCPQGQTFDDEDCACRPCEPESCAADEVWDATACRCACEPIDCPTGKIQEEHTCDCECAPVGCPEGYSQDSQTCECGECETVTCPDGQYFDASLCQCRSVSVYPALPWHDGNARQGDIVAVYPQYDQNFSLIGYRAAGVFQRSRAQTSFDLVTQARALGTLGDSVASINSPWLYEITGDGIHAVASTLPWHDGNARQGDIVAVYPQYDQNFSLIGYRAAGVFQRSRAQTSFDLVTQARALGTLGDSVASINSPWLYEITECVAVETDPLNCGSCGHPCPVPNNATATCEEGECDYHCEPGFGDCNGRESDGCEINLQTDVENCGACGRPCGAVAHASIGCENGGCVITGCEQGYGDCDHLYDNGCETDLRTDETHCGGCGDPCPPGKTCANGSCL